MKQESAAPSDLFLSGLGLQNVLLPDGVEHAALPAEVSEALFLIVPVHLHNSTKKKPLAAVCIPRIVSQTKMFTSVARRRMNMGRPSMTGVYLSISNGSPVRFPS